MWILCRVSDVNIFEPTVYDSEGEAIARMINEASLIIKDLEKRGIEYYGSSCLDGHSRRIITNDNTWIWRVSYIKIGVDV